MQGRHIDVLMITYNRPTYTRISLSELLRRSDPSTRVWVWHNGNDPETLQVVESHRSRLYRVHHSEENVGLTEPTNWLLRQAEGAYVSKVDDDCIVPELWDMKLRRVHEEEPQFGVIGCWRFPEEDFLPEIAARKIKTFRNGHQLLVNMWVEGSGFLMKRSCVERMGLLQRHQSFTDYCIHLSRSGWINGWVYPFLYQEHMDDPRSPHSGLRSDRDLAENLPLSAKKNGVTTLDAWLDQLRRSARIAQEAPIDLAYWSPFRRRCRRLLGKVRRTVTGAKNYW